MSYHRPDLIFSRSAGPDDGLLDHRRRVLRDIEPLLLRGQQNHAPRVAEHEGGADVLMIEGVFEGEYGRLMALDESCDLVVQLRQPVRQGIAPRETKDTAFDETAHAGRAIPRFDHAIARDLGTGIDAQDLHVIPSPPPWPPRRCRSWKRPSRRRPFPRVLRRAAATASHRRRPP